MRETKQKQIGDRGYTYHVNQFGARHGGRVLVRLLKMIGGAAGDAMQGDDVAGFDAALVGKLVSNLAETAKEEDFDFLCDTFAKASQVSGGEFANPVPLSSDGLLDLHFAGCYKELGHWILFAVEVNFGNFLADAGIEPIQKAPSDRPVSVVTAGAKTA